MKNLIRFLSIFMIIAAIVLYVFAIWIEEDSKGNEISIGIVTNGQYKEIDSGYIGQNTEAKEDMFYLKGIAIVFGIAGIIGLIASVLIKEEKPQY